MSNRAAKYELLHKSLKKHYKPLPEPGERAVLDHLVYACCLEDAKADQADEAFAKLQQAYFDWNEVRVTSLPNPIQAGHRIKRCLQSLFEARYQYDIDDMKKANLGKATEEIAAWKGVSSFILNYVSQNALGGHAIPADTMTLNTLVQADILTESEAEKKTLPGIERAIPKTKGSEFASLLHQFGVEFQVNQKSTTALAVFKDLGVTPKPKAKLVEKPVAKIAKGTKPVETASEPIAAPKTKSGAVSHATVADITKKADKSKVVEQVDKHVPTKSEPAKLADKKSDLKKPEVKKPIAVVPAKDAKKSDVKPAGKTDDKASKAKTPPKKGAETKKPSKVSPPKTKSSPAKSASNKPAAKPDVSKPNASKPSSSKSSANKSSPTKSSPAKTGTGKSGAGKPNAAKPTPSKSGSKEATNVKMTKKKPR
jgi:hypothetical protein